MSDVQDPVQETEKVTRESASPVPDKKIVFGARKPTEEVSAVIGIPSIIEAPFPFERTLQWLPDGVVLNHSSDEPTISSPTQTADEPALDAGIRIRRKHFRDRQSGSATESK